MSFLPVYTYFIGLSFIVSILVLKRNSPFYLKLFSPFLLLTFLIEVYASYLSTINKPNIVIYNFFSAFEFSFYLFWISHLFRNRKAKQLALLCAFLYSCAAIVNILFIQGINAFHTTSYAAGCLMLVAFCIYYFYELFKFPGTGKLEKNPAFWISTGLLFFYCCGFPLWGLMNFWSDKLKYLIENLAMITNILNSFLYSLFTIAYLCNRTRNSISLSS